MDRLRDQRGFTLTEMLVAVVAIVLLIAGALAIQQSGLSLYLSGSSRVETLQNARVALARMARELKAASDVRSAPLMASDLTFRWRDGSGTDPVIRYQLVGTELKRTQDANPAETMIGGVQALTFIYRDSANAVTTNKAKVRRIDITLRVGTEQAVQAGSAADAKSEVTTTVRLRNLL